MKIGFLCDPKIALWDLKILMYHNLGLIFIVIAIIFIGYDNAVLTGGTAHIKHHYKKDRKGKNYEWSDNKTRINPDYFNPFIIVCMHSYGRYSRPKLNQEVSQ